jgi:hypothetical protein
MGGEWKFEVHGKLVQTTVRKKPIGSHIAGENLVQ